MPNYVEAFRLLSKIPQNLNYLFKPNNMETKEIKIIAPDGYEIDKENSTFEVIKLKPIDKKLTYEDVAKELFQENKEFFIIDEYYILPANSDNKNITANLNCTSQKQAKKLIAINKLMNVAKYLNGDWRPDFSDDSQIKYTITDGLREFGLSTALCVMRENITFVYFKSRELAQLAIDILGEDTIRTALSTDW